MERLNVKTMLLELTRECNLACKHCFRGDSQNVYMNTKIIDYIFKNVCRINEFLLTGGEPLLAKEQIKSVTDNIMKERINIGKTIIVTNGTVLSNDLIDMLFQISKRTDLEIRLSNDAFHLMEIKEKGLESKREENIELLKSFFNVYVPEDNVYFVDKVGRAKNLTDEDLDLINKNNPNTKYVFSNNRILQEYRKAYPLPILGEDNVVEGTLNIDVYGNITPTYYSYDTEDRNSYSIIKRNKTLKRIIDEVKTI